MSSKAKIIRVMRPVRYGGGDAYALVTVQLDHGGYSEVWVGGDGEEYRIGEKNRFHISRNKHKKSVDKVQGNKVQ